jgi:hypothetical protein
MKTENMSLNECRQYWLENVGHDGVPGFPYLDTMRRAVADHGREKAAQALWDFALARGGAEIGTGGNCRALAINAPSGLLVLITDGDAGTDFSSDGARFYVSACNLEGYGLAAFCDAPADQEGARLALLAVQLFMGMSEEAIKSAPLL